MNLTERAPSTDRFRADVLRGLHAAAKELPCKYFYDETGSRLFEQICALDEYYLTRTGLTLMQRHGAEMAALVGRQCLLIEYGSGSGITTRLLLDHLDEPAGYVPIDISGEHLRQTARILARSYPHVAILPVHADFTDPIELPCVNGAAARHVIFFPGSTIGNFTPVEAIALLGQAARLCGPGGGMLLGADRKKDPRIIDAAYNDARGITAAFNLNLLVRINRELQADFPIDQFWHHAFYDPSAGRIEMHLLSQRDQRVRIGTEEVVLEEGESIRTEYSYKYRLKDLRALAIAGGFEVSRVWTDERDYFSVLYLTVR